MESKLDGQPKWSKLEETTLIAGTERSTARENLDREVCYGFAVLL